MANDINKVITSFKGLLPNKNKSESQSSDEKLEDSKEKKGISPNPDTPISSGKKGKTSRLERLQKKEPGKKDLKEISIITDKERLPSFKQVLSGKSNAFEISAKQKEDYVVLFEKEDRDKRRYAIILISDQKVLKSGFNTVLESMKKRLQTEYFSVEVLYATKNIIKLLYDDEDLLSTESVQEDKNVSNQIETYDALLLEGYQQNYSDIHIEVRRDQAEIRVRKNGLLQKYKDYSVIEARQLATVIYQVVAEEKDVTFQENTPQDAIVNREISFMDDEEGVMKTVRVRVRVATVPAYPAGFDMVQRILPMGITGGKSKPKIKDLQSLGYTDLQVKNIAKAIARPVGVTVIAGTTGSGKSTSLNNMIITKIIEHNKQIKVFTVEDPPEYFIPNATQVPVVRSVSGADGGNPFAKAIRAAMRSDPDVLLIGEVRDHHSSELLVHAVQSGHQAFTTVHAPSAISIVGRFRSLGIKNDVLGSRDFISGLIYQALLPVLCPSCRVSIESVYNSPKSEEKRYIELKQRIDNIAEEEQQSGIYFRSFDGCENCDHGVIGRQVVAEIVVPDTTMFNYFLTGQDTKAWEAFMKGGGRSVLREGIDKMLVGISDPFDIEHKLGLLDSEKYLFKE